MKVVFFGSSDFSLEPVKALAGLKHDLVGVVTVPPAQKGRGQVLQKTEVHEWAEGRKIRVWCPEKLRSEEFLNAIRALQPDVFVVCSYGKILPQVVLDIPSRLALNVHPSLLPKYRGAAPLNWQLINGEEYGGLTLFRMDAEMDSGDIVWQERFPIDLNETAETLSGKFSKMAAEKLSEILDRVEKNALTFTPQDHTKMTLAPKLSKADAKLDWGASAKELHNRVRGLLPWPCAYTYFRGETVRILKTVIARRPEGPTKQSDMDVTPAQAGVQLDSRFRGNDKETSRNDSRTVPGQILTVRADGALSVASGKDELLVYQVQRENRKPMSAKEFANGVRLTQNDRFE